MTELDEDFLEKTENKKNKRLQLVRRLLQDFPATIRATIESQESQDPSPLMPYPR